MLHNKKSSLSYLSIRPAPAPAPASSKTDMNNECNRRRRESRSPMITVVRHILLLHLLLAIIHPAVVVAARRSSSSSSSYSAAAAARALQAEGQTGLAACAGCPNDGSRDCVATSATIGDPHCAQCSTGQTWWPCDLVDECHCRDPPATSAPATPSPVAVVASGSSAAAEVVTVTLAASGLPDGATDAELRGEGLVALDRAMLVLADRVVGGLEVLGVAVAAGGGGTGGGRWGARASRLRRPRRRLRHGRRAASAR